MLVVPIESKVTYIHTKGRVSVIEVLKLEQAMSSTHLGILRKEELVLTEWEGKNVYYSINYARL